MRSPANQSGMGCLYILILFCSLLFGCLEESNNSPLIFKASYRSATDSGHIFLRADNTYQWFSGVTTSMGSSVTLEGTYDWRDSIIVLNNIAPMRKAKTNRFLITHNGYPLIPGRNILRPIDAGLNIVDSSLVYTISINKRDSLP